MENASTPKALEATTNIVGNMTPFEDLGISSEWSGGYSLIRQGTLNNGLNRVGSTGTSITKDSIAGKTTYSINGYSLKLPENYPEERLRDSFYDLFDYMTEKFTADGAKSETVLGDLSEYMALRGVSGRKKARAAVVEDLETIRVSAVTFYEKRKGSEPLGYIDVNLADSVGISRGGSILLKFSQSAYQIMKQYPVMPLPRSIYRLDGRKNPNSRSFLRRINEHKHMNAGKKNENTISVKTLLKASKIPSYADVMAGARQIGKRIIDPFERDLDALSDTFSWEYCHRNGAPLEQDEIDNFSYDLFQSLNVRINWKNYPDQSHLIEARTAQAEKAAKAKKKKLKEGEA